MKKNKKRLLLAFLFALCAVMMFAVPVSAAKRKNEWVKTYKGNVYYYNEKGKKVKGMQKIKKKWYYFDSKGRQRTGWQKIGKYYYFFKIAEKGKGYRVSSKTVNGIKLKANGRAKMNDYSKRKLPLLIKSNEIMWSITKRTMTKSEKLQAAFNYAKNNIRARNIGGFRNGSNWDMFYAEYAFRTGTADCYGQGVMFAYLANAAGYKVTAVSSGGHGWAEIGSKVYDPNCALWLHCAEPDFYAMDINLSGVGGRPSYKRTGIYRITI